jgi:hypothetical protein
MCAADVSGKITNIGSYDTESEARAALEAAVLALGDAP